MRRKIPAFLISTLADVLAASATHSTINGLFLYAGASGDEAPPGNKLDKVTEWLRRTNKDESIRDPMEVVGRLIEGFMEADCDTRSMIGQANLERREALATALARGEFQYVRGAKITSAMGTPSKSLEDLLRERNVKLIDEEFERALRNVDTSPREASSAAANILESLCKVYIEEEKLTMPTKQDLAHVWDVVRKDLGFEPGRLEHDDLREILSGLLAIVSGVGKLRTHASSAHGASTKTYKLEPRHAKLTVHAAHTVVAYVLEVWDTKKSE